MNTPKSQKFSGSKRKTITLLTTVTPLLLVAFCACGRETKVYPGAPTVTNPVNPTTETTIVITDGNALPKGFLDQSVNQAKVDLALDGSTATTVAAKFSTFPTTNTQGSFNGNGNGNRALLGATNYSEKKLTDISSVTFDAKIANGSEKFSVLMLVDLDCSGGATRVFIANSASLSPGSAQADGYTRYSAGFSENRWLVSGASIVDASTNPATTLVASTNGGTASSLTKFLTKYPKACIRNTSSTDDSLPKSAALGGILFALGEDTTSDANSAFINRISIGSDVVEATDWGKK